MKDICKSFGTIVYADLPIIYVFKFILSTEAEKKKEEEKNTMNLSQYKNKLGARGIA